MMVNVAQLAHITMIGLGYALTGILKCVLMQLVMILFVINGRTSHAKRRLKGFINGAIGAVNM